MCEKCKDTLNEVIMGITLMLLMVYASSAFFKIIYGPSKAIVLLT
jgi:hypothetical protein